MILGCAANHYVTAWEWWNVTLSHTIINVGWFLLTASLSSPGTTLPYELIQEQKELPVVGATVLIAFPFIFLNIYLKNIYIYIYYYRNAENWTHLIQDLQFLLTSWWLESGVSDKVDIQNVQGRGAWSTGLKTTALNNEDKTATSIAHL